MLTPLLVAATVIVAATTTDLRDLVAAVGGDRVSVESLTEPRADPHAREIHPRQLARLRAAQVLVRIGLDHESWLPRALRAARATPRDLDASRGIALLDTETARLSADRRPHVHAFGNTHYWLDPENARPITALIVDALAAVDSAGRGVFVANRERFLRDLDARLARWRRALRPYAGTRVVVAHDTWPYFARRFDLTIVATVEEQPGVPPSPRHLGALIAQMKTSGVRAILAEPGAPTAVLARVAAETGARVITLVPSVGADPEATDYLALFDVNVRRLADALAR
ncbi:MAG TPA: metal ABC transporter substrate-binding protein [Candidatus Acidoferrum sp.]|nr:metal ABC transporter substrate-binding protein [Candidatus Acidoferrum sp.]